MCLDWHEVSVESRGIADDTGKETEDTQSGTTGVNMEFKFRMKKQGRGNREEGIDACSLFPALRRCDEA
jgi:hypothetical protein